MSLPKPVEALWSALQAVRADVLAEAEGLSQRQADWKPGEKEWSVGEIVHHLTIAEIATGKLTTKLAREADAAGTRAPFPAGLAQLKPMPAVPIGAAEAPPGVWLEHGKPTGAPVATKQAPRGAGRQADGAPPTR